MPDTRLDPRADVRIPVQVLGPDGRSSQVSMETINLSSGGAYCRVPEHVPLRSQIRIQLDLPTAARVESIVADAIVLRVDPQEASRGEFLVALYFINLGSDDRSKLRRFVFDAIASHSTPER